MDVTDVTDVTAAMAAMAAMAATAATACLTAIVEDDVMDSHVVCCWKGFFLLKTFLTQ